MYEIRYKCQTYPMYSTMFWYLLGLENTLNWMCVSFTINNYLLCSILIFRYVNTLYDYTTTVYATCTHKLIILNKAHLKIIVPVPL